MSATRTVIPNKGAAVRRLTARSLRCRSGRSLSSAAERRRYVTEGNCAAAINFGFSLIVIVLVGGCVGNQVDESDKTRSYLDQTTFSCVVDSSIYTHPERSVKDGVKVTFERSKVGFEKVLVNGEDIFRYCEDRTVKVGEQQVRNLFTYMDVDDPDRFVGAEVGLCRRVDDGWFFILKEETAYIGYTGPAEYPLSVVGMSCE